MKKFLSILLALTLLAGCAPLQEPETEPPVQTDVPEINNQQQEETSAPQEEVSEPGIAQLPMVAVSVPLTVDTVTADDGTTIFRHTHQSMQLTMRDPDVADKIIIDFLNRVDAHAPTAESILQTARNDYTGIPQWNTYFYDLIYNPTRTDHNVLSLFGESVSYSGGNHPQRICVAANYNMVTGDVLTLGSILYHIDSKDALAELVIQSLDAIAEEKYLLDGYDDVVRKRFAVDESFDEDWYFTDEGLCFYFAPYEIAPYSSGVITAQIPYSQLTGIIDDAFFPAETDLVEGSILATPLDNADMEQFTQIAEVTIDQDGEMFFLYTTGIVRDLRIQAYNVSVDGYTEASTIFATYTLSPGDAIMLKISLNDEAQGLQLSYKSGGEDHHITLTPDFLNN